MPVGAGFAYSLGDCCGCTPCCTIVRVNRCGSGLSDVDVTVTRTSDSVVILSGTTDCYGKLLDGGEAEKSFCDDADMEVSIDLDYAHLDLLEVVFNGSVITLPYIYNWTLLPCAPMLSFTLRQLTGD